jgi:HEPN domain-containing protein
MARGLDKSKAVGYITKAENSLRISRIALKEKAYDAAVMNAVHAVINSLDALTTYFAGRRASGAHTEVLSIIKGILTQSEYDDTKRQFDTLMSMKNQSEYQPDLMSHKEAESAVKLADRVFEKVKAKLQSVK